MRFLIKAVNNILAKYKNMRVVDIDKSYNTSYITLKNGNFKTVVGYDNFSQTLKVEISNAVNLDFRNDLEKELEEVLIFK